MNEKKKGFNLFPEYAWMIFVGMLLAIIILTNVIPGHAANMYPLTPDDMGYGANYVSHITVKGSELYVGGTYIANVGQILQESEDRISKFESDADAALASFFAQIPKDQIYFGIADDSGYGSVLNWLRSFLDDRDIQYSEIIIDYDNPFWYPQLWPDDWKDDYSQSIYSLGPYSVNVYVRKILLSPSVTPTPGPEPSDQSFDILVYYDPWFSSEGNVIWHDGYYLFSFNASVDPSVEVPLSLAYSSALDSGYSNPWINNVVLLFRNNLNEFCLYFAGSLLSTEYRYLGTTTPSGSIDSIKSNFIPVSYTFSSNSFNLRTSSYGGLTCVSILSDVSLSSFQSNFVYNLGSYSSYQVDASKFFDFSSSSHSNPLYLAYCLGLTGSSSPSNPDLSPTPGPTATPEPLPTSGESIHVILPSGSPTPTPPFSVPGGSDGGTGSGSPGSIGSGLSSQTTSGILEYWSSFVADNPAMLFLTSTFQSLPSELLYPLYILLFILLLLAVIRLFVHFSGG